MTTRLMPRALGRWAPLTAVILGSAAFAAPAANGAIAEQNIGDGHVFDIVYNTSDIFLSDYPAGDHVVNVTRDGTLIATGTAALAGAPAEGGLNNGHVAPTDCWEGFTPQLLPGDVVSVTGPDGTDDQEIAGVTAQPISEEGTALVVRGTAAAADGSALDGASVDFQIDAPEGSRFSEGSSGNTFLSALAGDLGGTVNYNTTTKALEARWNNLSSGDRGLAFAGETL